jgi:ERCC4-type nuclease
VILYDPRFGSEKGHQSRHRAAVDALAALKAPLEANRQDFADFMFIGNGPTGPIPIGIELKAVPDFITSMRTGRLREQLEGMLDTYKRVYVILEGVYRARRGSGILEVPRGRQWKPVQAGPRPVFWTDVERFITGIEEAGVRVVRTRSTEQTARTIWNVLYAFWDKPYADHRSLQGVYQPAAPLELTSEKDPDLKVARLVACQLPGIGWGRSKSVVETFGSIEAMTGASVEAWAGVPGIGKTIATECYRIIRAKTKSAPATAGRVSKGAHAPNRSVRRTRKRKDK